MGVYISPHTVMYDGCLICWMVCARVLCTSICNCTSGTSHACNSHVFLQCCAHPHPNKHTSHANGFPPVYPLPTPLPPTARAVAFLPPPSLPPTPFPTPCTPLPRMCPSTRPPIPSCGSVDNPMCVFFCHAARARSTCCAECSRLDSQVCMRRLRAVLGVLRAEVSVWLVEGHVRG